MPATDAKPKRIKSILDYLQQDVPKIGGSEESVPGQSLGEPGSDQPVDVNAVAQGNDDKLKRKPKPKSFA